MSSRRTRPVISSRWTTSSTSYTAATFFSTDSTLYFGFWRTKPLYIVSASSVHAPLVTDELTFQWEAELSSTPVLLFRAKKLFFLVLLVALAGGLCFQLLYTLAPSFSSFGVTETLLWCAAVCWVFGGLAFFWFKVGGALFYLSLGVWGALFSMKKSTLLESVVCSQTIPTPIFQSSSYAPTHTPSTSFFFYTYQIFSRLSFTSQFPPLSLGVITSSNVSDQVFSFISWLPSTQAQLVVPSVFRLKGFSSILIQPQLVSQTLNTSSWLFLRGLHQINTSLPVASSSQAADLWAFHRELKLFWAGTAVASVDSSRLWGEKSPLNLTTSGFISLPPRAFTLFTPFISRNFFWQKFLFSPSFYSGAWFWVGFSHSSVVGLSFSRSTPLDFSAWM